jgi:hypothetical protein
VTDRGSKNSFPGQGFIHQQEGCSIRSAAVGLRDRIFCASFFGLAGGSKRNLIPEVVLLAGDPREGVLELRILAADGGDIPLYRDSGNGLAPILLVAAEETSPGCAERLQHEYALKAELDADWAARPVALTHYNDRLTLVLEDPGGSST